MMRELIRPGVRAFTVACGLTLVVAVLHGLGLSGDEEADPQTAELLDAMRGAVFGDGPFAFSMYDVLAGVWLQVSALLVMLSGKNLLLLVVVPPATRPGVVRALSLFDAACYAVLTALFVYYRIPPPLVSFAILTVVFLIAATLSRRPPAAARIDQG